MVDTKTVITIDPAAYIKRTAKLDLEAQGFYVRLPDCERELGAILKCDVRKVRRLMRLIRRAGLVESRFGLKGGA